jgi:flagella basal body P-ring formation protein FlgA
MAIEKLVAPLAPPPDAAAPASWVEVMVPDRPLPLHRDWHAELGTARPLAPGRNLVPVAIVSGDRKHRFSVEVVLHAFAELPVPRQMIGADTPLTPDLFTWEWSDLCAVAPGLAVGRDAIAGASAGHDLAAGQPVRQADLRPTPLVRSGDPVELRIARGTVTVAVRAVARRSGALGQEIPVRNELTGRVVTARVAAPGVVDWRP